MLELVLSLDGLHFLESPVPAAEKEAQAEKGAQEADDMAGGTVIVATD